MTLLPPEEAIQTATEAALKSVCQKSKRGAVIFMDPTPYSTESRNPLLIASGFNQLPIGNCSGSPECRKFCGRRCVHAEQDAIIEAMAVTDGSMRFCILLHIKVVDGVAVPGGGPSCLECSKLILHSGIMGVWLWENKPAGPEWVYRTAEQFNRATLENLGLPTT